MTLVSAACLAALPAAAKPGHDKHTDAHPRTGGKPGRGHLVRQPGRAVKSSRVKKKQATPSRRAARRLAAQPTPTRRVTRVAASLAPSQATTRTQTTASVRRSRARRRARAHSAARRRASRRLRRLRSAPARRTARVFTRAVPAATAVPRSQAAAPAASRRTQARAPAAEPKNEGPIRAVTKVVERVPTWLWVLLAAIAGLCVAAFATSVLAALRARRADRQRREVMEDVGLLQAALLPPVPAKVAGLELSVAYRPADGPAAGGDFYDAFSMRGGPVGLIIGDVSGHGRTSLAQTALVRFTVRAYLDAGLEPRDALKLSQSALEDKLGEEFVTVMLAVFDPRSATLTYAGAGHPPPLLRGALPIPAVTAASAPLIGAGLGTGLRQTTVSLHAGTSICLYTDGLVEAMVDHRMLGRNRLAGLLDTLGPEATAAKLLDRVVEETDRAGDDMAVCLARVSTPAATERTPYLLEELEVSRRDVGHGLVHRFLGACNIRPAEVEEAMRKARTLSEEFGAALLRVHRHEHPQRVEVTAASVEGLVAPTAR